MSNIEIYRIRKRAMEEKRRRIFIKMLGMSVLSGLVIMLICFFVMKAPVQAESEGNTYFKYYETIRVEKGDTLWGYAEKYSEGSGKSRAEYIDELCSINHISKQATLRSGDTITVPYYSAEYICSVD